MISISDLRKTWAGHTAVESLCDALDRANNSIANWFDNALYWQRRAEEAERERDAFLTFGQGGASFEEAQWIDKLRAMEERAERAEAHVPELEAMT